jgi:hypothetical protein
MLGSNISLRPKKNFGAKFKTMSKGGSSVP